MKPPRIRLLGQVTGLPIYLVDGEKVRNEIDIDFTCGGHRFVYPNYIPGDEIWIDNALSPLDRTATLLHEVVERNLMADKGWGYDQAHDAASARERPFRIELMRDPPKTLDIERVVLALATKVKPIKKNPPPGKRRAPHNREYPRVAAVGKRRKKAVSVAKLERDINAFLSKTT